MDMAALLEGVGIGLAGGLSAGLFGVSPGGALVVFSVLFLGAEQHVAQGISLVAQIPPTGLAGISRYRQSGFTSPKRWLAFLLVGYLAGGVLGALAASGFGAGALRWVYVAYLATLLMLLLLRGGKEDKRNVESAVSSPHWASLLAVGIVAGASSGFLGIGGGLATTVGLIVGLRVGQHQAQMVSLALSLIPTTALSAWVYWREGWLAPWPLLLAVVAGLLMGTNLGARFATRVSAGRLKTALAFLVAFMTVYMCYAALHR